MVKDLVTKGTKDSLTKDPVNHVATQEVAKGRSGGSAKVKAKRRELQMKSADMLQSFSYVCRMFHFGSSRLFQHVFDDHEPNTVKTVNTFVSGETNVETNDETTDSDDDFMSCCEFETTDSEDDFMSCCGFVKMIMAHLDTWTGSTMLGGQVKVNLIGNAGVTGLLWTLVSGCCVFFLRWRT